METLPSNDIPVPGAPSACLDSHVERDRLQWWLADGGDPADLLRDLLDRHGLAADEPFRAGGQAHDRRPGTVCGAAVLISAAAAATMAGGPPGRPGPVPAVPDLVAIVYGHAARTDRAPAPAGRRPTAAPGGRSAAAGPAADWQMGPWQDSWTPAEHAAAVELARAAIARGDVYQVNVVGHASAPYAGDPGPALRRLARLPGARYGGVLAGEGWAVACASPETLVEVVGGQVWTRPIKGTRPATAAGRRELVGSEKERAEHIMIVDLARNDLARVARTGSVRVDELFAVRRWCGLWQAESTVSATLADGTDGLVGLLRAVCPGGSVTGAPKLAALAQIADLEPVGRGPSMGALGWVGRDRLDLGLTIRTAAADGERLHLWAGGGITWGSDPAAEVAEAAAKAAPIRAALGPVPPPSGA